MCFVNFSDCVSARLGLQLCLALFGRHGRTCPLPWAVGFLLLAFMFSYFLFLRYFQREYLKHVGTRTTFILGSLIHCFISVQESSSGARRFCWASWKSNRNRHHVREPECWEAIGCQAGFALYTQW